MCNAQARQPEIGGQRARFANPTPITISLSLSHTHTQTHVHKHRHTFAHTQITHITNAHTYTGTQVHIHVHRHAHTHTHMHTPFLQPLVLLPGPVWQTHSKAPTSPRGHPTLKPQGPFPESQPGWPSGHHAHGRTLRRSLSQTSFAGPCSQATQTIPYSARRPTHRLPAYAFTVKSAAGSHSCLS